MWLRGWNWRAGDGAISDTCIAAGIGGLGMKDDAVEPVRQGQVHRMEEGKDEGTEIRYPSRDSAPGKRDRGRASCLACGSAWSNPMAAGMALLLSLLLWSGLAPAFVMIVVHGNPGG
jgi:hypothetical protein